MINGVLVERTVKDVVPALKTNSEGLKKVLEDLVKQYNSKQVEMEKWKVSLSSKDQLKALSADFIFPRKRTISRWSSNRRALTTEQGSFADSSRIVKAWESGSYVRLHGMGQNAWSLGHKAVNQKMMMRVCFVPPGKTR